MAKRKKKQKPFTKTRVKRAVKQRAEWINSEDLLIVQELSQRIQNARNYMYSRLAGVNHYLNLQKPREIRNEWLKMKS